MVFSKGTVIIFIWSIGSLSNIIGCPNRYLLGKLGYAFLRYEIEGEIMGGSN